MTTLIIDIETLARPVPMDILQAHTKELQEEYVKPETVEKHLQAFKDKYKFMAGGADIICIGLCDIHTLECQVFSKPKMGAEAIMASVIDVLDQTANQGGLKLSGFNIKAFDLPIMLEHMQRMDLALPVRLGRYDVIDLMDECKHRGMAGGLAKINRMLGLPGKSGSGAEVEGLHMQDLMDGGTRVADYNKQDLLAEAALHKCLSRLWSL